MTEQRWLVLAVVMLAMFATGGTVLAGSVQLPQTGQTKCWRGESPWDEITCAGTGQDGEWRAGVEWPNPRFVITYCSGSGPCADPTSDCDGDASNDVITDELTGLMWSRHGNLPNGPKIWQEALDFANSLSLCGFTDWRLPNVNELESLVNADEPDMRAWLNASAQGFTGVEGGYHWSSTEYQNHARVVDMWGGAALGDGKNSSNYVWPVRSGQSAGIAQLWQTGLTTCWQGVAPYDQIPCAGTGSDGEWRAGVEWPNPRFVAGTGAEDQCVTDLLTGLMWPKDANLEGRSWTWQEALNYVNALALCGFSDWRLPNRKELRSLGDYSGYGYGYGPALPKGYPFSNVQSVSYWSASTISSDVGTAWSTNMWDGGSQYFRKWGSLNVWPVRGGQVHPVSSLTLTKSGSGTGRVTSIPTGIDCGTSCTTQQAQFVKDTSITLTATADSGFTFSGWSHPACPGTGDCSFTITEPITVTANFVGKQTLMVDLIGDGSVTSVPPGIDCGVNTSCTVEFTHGDTVTLTGTPGTNFSVPQWAGCDSAWGNECAVTMAAPKRVSVLFGNSVSGSHLLMFSSLGSTGQGTITTVPSSVTCQPGYYCPARFTHNATVTLQAQAGPGSTFEGWFGDGCSGTGTCSVKMDRLRFVQGYFSNSSSGIDALTSITTNEALCTTKLPLILIHGVHGTEDTNSNGQLDPPEAASNGYWTEFKKYFDLNLKDKFHLYEFSYLSDRVPASALAASLKRRIDDMVAGNEMEADKIAILAHSTGGLIARSYIQEQDGASRVWKLITLATPHHGTPGASDDLALQKYFTDKEWESIYTTAGFFYNFFSGELWNVSLPWLPTRSDLRWDGSDPLDDLTYNFGTADVASDANPWLVTLNSALSEDQGHRITAFTGYVDPENSTREMYQSSTVAAVTLVPITAKTSHDKLVFASAIMDYGLKGMFFLNDGMVPAWSAAMGDMIIGKRITCPTYDHLDMKDGKEAQCETGKTLFPSVKDELTYRILTVKVEGTGSGTVTSAPGDINCGKISGTCEDIFSDSATVTLVAKKTAGSAFAGWTGCPSPAGTTCTMTMSADRAVTATFNTVANLTINKTGSGTVTSDVGGIACGSACSAEFTPGTFVTLAASADPGSTFIGWTAPGCSGTGTCTLTMSSDVTVDITFVPCTYSLSATSKSFTANGGSVTITVKATGQESCPAPTVSETYDWVTTTAGKWAKNKGTVKITAPKTTTSQQRNGTVLIGGQSFSVSQLGAACAITKITPASQSFGKAAGTGSFTVQAAPADCGWTAAENPAVDWLAITSAPTGTGPGTISYSVTENTDGKARSGKIDVVLAQNSKKKTFQVKQGNK